MEWIKFDVKDRSTWPDENDYNIYLVWSGGYYEICKWNYTGGWDHWTGEERGDITHYMKLPPSPPGQPRWSEGKGWDDALGMEDSLPD